MVSLLPSVLWIGAQGSPTLPEQFANGERALATSHGKRVARIASAYAQVSLLAKFEPHGSGHRRANSPRGSHNVPIGKMYIAQRHLHVGVTEEPRDDGYGHAVHDGMTRHGVAVIPVSE